jgi:5-formyltetrahydrofolate cyclo-ligase
MTNLKSLKRNMRQQMNALLEKAGNDPQAGAKARDQFLAHFSKLDPGTIVSVTLSITHELDTMPLIEALAGKNIPLCLPVINGKGMPLLFRQYRLGDALEEKIWGLREPVESTPEVDPDLILCPLLAFDRKGGRLGRGAGYYDTTLKDARRHRKVLAVGYARSVQEVKEVPMGNIDEGLDLIITEKEVIRPAAGQA